MYDLQIEFPDAADPARPDLRDRRTDRRRGHGARRAPTARPRCARRRARRRRRRVGGGVPAQRLRQRGQRAAGRRRTCAASSGVPVCISSEISPQIREYPRMITTACNAATMPVIGPYLDELQKWLSAEGFGGSVLMMLSNGGVVSADDAAARPDPAGRVRSGRRRARRLVVRRPAGRRPPPVLRHGWHHRQGVPHRGRRARPHQHLRGRPGLPVQEGLGVPGVGPVGRSRRDRRRRRHRWPMSTSSACSRSVPESAGADPGPASYGRGGTEPDRHRRRRGAGPARPGRLPRRRHAARRRPRRGRAGPAGRGSSVSSAVDTAAGIHEIVNQNMAAAARMHAVEQGIDLRGVSLLAFGGAGPVHACGVAELLESTRVVFPVNASVLSAFGTLVSPGAHRPRPLDAAPSRRRSIAAERDGAARRAAHRGAARARRGRRARRAGRVPLRHRRPLRRAGQRDHDLGRRGRHLARRRCRGPRGVRGRVPPHLRPDHPRRRHRGRHLAAVGVRRRRHRRTRPGGRGRGRRPRRAPSDGVRPRRTQPVDTPVYQRDQLGAGATSTGPAVVEERETTAVIRPGWTVEVPADGSLVATRTRTTNRRSTTHEHRSIRSSSRSSGSR